MLSLGLLRSIPLLALVVLDAATRSRSVAFAAIAAQKAHLLSGCS